MTLERFIRAILDYMAKHGMLDDLIEKNNNDRRNNNE